MAENNTFQLTGNFKDNITPALRKLNTQLAATTKSFEKMQKMVRPIAKDMAIMGDAASRMTSGMGGQRNAFETNLRAMKDYRSELGKISSAQRQMERKFKVPAAPFAPASLPRGGGGGGGGRPAAPARTYAPDLGDGFTIEKGVLANLATNFIEGLFSQVSGAVGKAVNYFKGALQERIDDEMGDIQSAGGILSIGKEKKVPWADTYQEAFSIQKKLNGEMANLAAALPGETGQYVANMKQVTDTVMKVTVSNGPAMIKAMQGYNSSVKTNQDAYVEATKQLAKFTTLASLGQEGGVPLTALAEQMLNSEKVNIQSMKKTYAGLEKNPLVSGALEKYEKEMNKAAAGSAERYAAMIKAFEQAFPVEVLDAMTNSADGIIQGLKSGLLNPDTGLLGLGRAIEVNFSGLNRKMGPAMEQLSVFDMFLQMFKAFGMVMSPIVSVLPKIIEPFKNLINPLREFYVVAENTISNFKGETKRFAKMKLDFAEFRGSLSAIGKLAKAFGGDKAEIGKLDQMLMSGNLDFGAALQQAFKALFSSEALEKFGKAVGEALSGFLSMLAGLAKTGGELANQSGLIKGFRDGWKKNDGTKALINIVKELIGLIVKSIVLAGFEILTTEPVSATVVAALFFSPVREAIKSLLKNLGKSVAKMLTSKALSLGGVNPAAAARLGGGKTAAVLGKRALTAVGSQQAGALKGLPGAGLTQKAGSGLAKAAAGAKMKGLGVASAAIVKFSTVSPQLAQAGKALAAVGKRIPLLSVALAGLDFASRKAEGESTAKAAGGAGGSLVGGVVGGAVGTMIAPGVGTAIGSVLGSVLGDWVGSNLGPMLSGIPNMLSSAWQGVLNFFRNLPQTIVTAFTAFQTTLSGLPTQIGMAIGAFAANVVNAFQQLPAQFSSISTSIQTAIGNFITGVGAFIATLPSKFQAWVTGIQAGFSSFISTAKAIVSNPSTYTGLAQGILMGITGGLAGLPGMISGAVGNLLSGVKAGYQQQAAKNAAAKPAGAKAKAYGEPGKGFKSLSGAINYEMANKPPGSDLVIANSSETVIPAAGGYGAGEFMETLKQGFSVSQMAYERIATGVNLNKQNMIQGFQKDAERSNQTNQKIDKYQSTTASQITNISTNVAALAAQVKQMGAMGMMGGMGGGGGAGGAGGGGAIGGAGTGTGPGYGGAGSKIAGALGTYIKQTGGAPGSIHEHPQHGGVRGKHSPTSYHYQGRAIDIGAYANEQAGVMARIAQFNAKNGVKPVEWLHAKNAGGHNDHVHVAYNQGNIAPLLDELSKMPSGAKLAAANTSEFVANKDQTRVLARALQSASVAPAAMSTSGMTPVGASPSVSSPVTVNAPITITQQPGQDPEQLAMIVAEKIGEAVADARLASILV